MITFLKNLLQKIKEFLHLSAKPNPARELPPTPVAPKETNGVPFVQIGVITATPDETKKIKQGVALLNKVLATETFKQKVLKTAFTETNGMSSAQIYKLMCAKVVKIDVNVFMGTYYQNHISKTIGYEDQPGVVNINRYFVAEASEFADNIIHEALGHSLGFSHYGVYATSVPYQLNDIYEACVEELFPAEAA